MNFAKTFQLLRIRYGLTQEQFAEQTGLGAISDIETGRREPRIDVLQCRRWLSLLSSLSILKSFFRFWRWRISGN
jgi:hypothetical protein